MPQLIPTWVKAVLLLLAGIIGAFMFSGEKKAGSEKVEVIDPGPSLNRGLPGKAALNTKQVLTGQIFSPVLEPEQTPIIIRPKEGQYYSDEK